MDLKEILELAGAIRVKGHTRVTKGGKTVRVKSYSRTPVQIMKEVIQKAGKDASDSDLRQAVHKETGRFPTRNEMNQARKFIPSKPKGAAAALDDARKAKGLPVDFEKKSGATTGGGPGASPGSFKGPKKPKLDLDGDILAQYKKEPMPFNSKGQDDFGKEAASKMSDEQLEAAIAFKKQQIKDKKGQSAAADLRYLEQELASRGQSPSGEGSSARTGGWMPTSDEVGIRKLAGEGGPISATKDALEKATGRTMGEYYRGDIGSEYGGGTSNKYWEAVVIKNPDGSAALSVKYGARGKGARGQQKVVQYKTVAEATSAFLKQRAAKQKKGYADDQYEQKARNENLVDHWKNSVNREVGLSGESFNEAVGLSAIETVNETDRLITLSQEMFG